MPAGPAGQYRAPFRYVNISPVTVDPGNYVIVAFYPSGASGVSDAVGGHLGGNDMIFTPPAVTVTGGRHAIGGDVFPAESDGVEEFGPNMLITVIPEPGAIALLTLGTGAIALRPARRRQK